MEIFDLTAYGVEEISKNEMVDIRGGAFHIIKLIEALVYIGVAINFGQGVVDGYQEAANLRTQICGETSTSRDKTYT